MAGIKHGRGEADHNQDIGENSYFHTFIVAKKARKFNRSLAFSPFSAPQEFVHFDDGNH